MRAVGKYIILVDISRKESVSATGLLLSGDDVSAMRYTNAKVHRVGDQVTVIKEGDEVYYDKSSSFKMMIEGEQYTIISERDVVMVT